MLNKQTGQNLAHLSLQMANKIQGTVASGRKISAGGFQQNQLNFVNDQLNVQKHSAEDLLKIEKDISCSPAAVHNPNMLTRNLAMN